MTIFLGILFSSIGGIYLFLGRREHDPVYLLIGFTLIVYPYFVTNIALMIAVGIVLSAIPFARSRGWF